MSVPLDKTWHFLDRLQQAVDPRDVETILAMTVRRFGFRYIFGNIVPTGPVSRAYFCAHILTQRRPEEWGERYVQANYFLRDPVMRRLQTDRNPFSWDEAYRLSPFNDNEWVIKGEASEFGLHDGFVVPVSLLDGNHAALSFSGQKVDLSPDDQSLLGFVASCAIGQLLQLRKAQDAVLCELTPREYDCLLWAAEGKSEWVIAQILRISRPTVTKHLSSARQKLGASTRSHAVAIAMRKGIIR